jgi:DNA polymerase III epsilon subunit-like protein
VIFIDTETTGLSASQLPFVLGALSVDLRSGRMQLAQWALRAREAEVEMLRRFESWLKARSVLAMSSFNGASFDLPLLRRRMSRLALEVPAAIGGAAPHLDLLHLARRLWRDRLPDCRLVSLEAARLGRRRRGDIPSAMIPAVFSEFLVRPDSARARDQLDRVEHHNRLDLWSLPELLCNFGRTLEAPRCWTDRHRAARHFCELGRQDWARPVLESGLLDELSNLNPGQLARKPVLKEVVLEAARLGRQRHDLNFCSTLLSLAHRAAPQDAELCERYAIHLEHRVKDLPTALAVAESSSFADAKRISRLRDRCARATAPQARSASGGRDEVEAGLAPGLPLNAGRSGSEAGETRRQLANPGQTVSESVVLSSPRACVPRARPNPGFGHLP